MSTSIESPDAGYWLATGPAEVEHLAAQAEIYAPEADELLDRIGLDLKPRLLALAAELAARRGIEIEAVRADAAATALPTGEFDLVHARTLLINVTNPETVLAEPVRG